MKMNNIYLYIKSDSHISIEKMNFIINSLISVNFQLTWNGFFGKIELEDDNVLENLYSNYDALKMDLMEDLTVIIVPYFNRVYEKLILDNKCDKGLYPIVKILPKLIKEDETLLYSLTEFKNKVNEQILQTAIAYVEANMSVNLVSKMLTTHRNTINYRLNRFIELTNINIRIPINGYYVYLLITWSNQL